jgi:hypothetical protein
MRRSMSDSLPNVRDPVIATMGDVTLLGVESRTREDTARHVFAVRALDAARGLTPWVVLGADASSGRIAAAGARHAFACWTERDGDAARVRLASLVPARGR